MKKLLTLTAVAVLGISLGISSLAVASENIVVNTDSLPSSLSKSSTKSVEVNGAGAISAHTEFYMTPKGLANESVNPGGDDGTYIVFGVRIDADRAS